ncbi:Pc22g26210 [Penicillium rubens Wisconsin 54-1255]|uniref:Pc22g26210 protein n=1 Tax=Penicillium rubens (strain ATCC 28089 / DSM 1075 / NRRL 1951 / Wisconsin 54-1255) TaxID=500485 RepID=B6HTE6_PENRW|nr:Pc22g26210 [Penicillium rubens Wisconsin 54-1255]
MSRRSPEEPEYAHFAMVYIDSNGNLCQRASDSISESLQSILSPSVTGRFLQAVAMSRETHGTRRQGILVPPNRQPLNNSSAPSQGQSASYSGMELGSPQRMQVPFPSQPEPPFQPAMWPSRESWPLQAGSQAEMNFGGRTLNLASHQRVLISIKDRCLLRRYYEKIFQTLQQTNCRIIAKAYIKLVEPRKQVNYPYNGRKVVEGRTQQLDPEETKPPWRPRGVSHREPDHLPKIERIRLLVHMLCDMHETHGVTAARLKQCDQSIRHQILPVERLETLDEAYRVREEEGRFLDGISGTYLSALRATGKFTVGMTACLPDASGFGVIFLGLEDFVAADHTFSNCC